MKHDEYGEVINDEETYQDIATELIGGPNGGRSMLIGWTDQNGTHLDILFTLTAQKHGTVQGGVRGGDLFISIMRWGAFGFSIDEKETHAGYYDEKLGNRGSLGPTAEPLAELINGVKKYL